MPTNPTQDKPTAAASRSEATGKYYVTAAGAPYAVAGQTAFTNIAMHGHVIDLADEEAMRLLTLNAIRAATDEEVKADVVRRQVAADAELVARTGPDDNPFGGRVAGTTLEDHAAEQIALAHKAAK